MEVTRHSFHTAEILKDVRDRLKTATGLDVFVGDRPTSTKDSLSEFLIVSMPYSVRSKGAYQTSYMRIEIFVKDKIQGVTNIVKLDEISNKLIEMFPMNGLENRYNIGTPTLVLQGKDNIGYTIWNLQGSLRINKLDTYNIIPSSGDPLDDLSGMIYI